VLQRYQSNIFVYATDSFVRWFTIPLYVVIYAPLVSARTPLQTRYNTFHLNLQTTYATNGGIE